MAHFSDHSSYKVGEILQIVDTEYVLPGFRNVFVQIAECHVVLRTYNVTLLEDVKERGIVHLQGKEFRTSHYTLRYPSGHSLKNKIAAHMLHK